MSFLLFGFLSIVICWKWGNWKNWKEYYPTMLYFTTGNLIYDVLTQMKPLWNFGEIVKHYPVFEVLMMLCLYPSTTILYFTFYPSSASFKKQALYILLWVSIYTVVELLSHITGGFSYENGWNICYSILFNLLMFPLLRLHFKKPLLTWFFICFLGNNYPILVQNTIKHVKSEGIQRLYGLV